MRKLRAFQRCKTSGFHGAYRAHPERSCDARRCRPHCRPRRGSTPRQGRPQHWRWLTKLKHAVSQNR